MLSPIRPGSSPVEQYRFAPESQGRLDILLFVADVDHLNRRARQAFGQ
jgi:hypothetical protein